MITIDKEKEIQRVIAQCLPEFQQVNHYWDRRQQRVIAKILPGEFYVTSYAVPISTTLGSCVSACIWDYTLGIGGMNHFMLPMTTQTDIDIKWGNHSVVSDATRYGNYAMEYLINTILKQGGTKKNLRAKVFGGGKLIQHLSNIGYKNSEFVLTYLEKEQIPIIAQDLGSFYPRKVLFEPDTGRAFVKKLDNLHNDTITRRERDYEGRIEHQAIDGDIELFEDR